ncbi:sigma-54 dependent DNA-binding response regulator, Fis family protein [Galbibacter marinus]|uniref:Sigma-54 dependent DNA-binding response regulator, Fis family protein n=1 Tax=Galbibacter marinus TaxID=555500 RepID=K2PPY2_9FLAO|nr:sigma-54 dependent transcriptional regulator [Galbibacter marinus]EKF54620.1 sigma-54 dependent DNA-binding response regulator, Fis family protein [Galbibacter marinus]
MQLNKSKILVLDDDNDVLIALRLLLKSKVKEVVTEKNPNNIMSLFEKHNFDIVILDMNFNSLVNTGNEGIFWLTKIKQISPDTCVILITAYGDIDLAVRSLKEGASDFLMKPWENERIIQTLKELSDKQGKKYSSKSFKTDQGKIIGESGVMKNVFLKLEKIAPTDANVLLLGENGTGKDLIAKAIHENSLRKDKPFVKVDVGALTTSLFESELFGYKKGAFTDAREDRKGRFETASGGTLFLDEIGNISLQQQARLLTVLQNRQITPLGSNEPINIDIRLICATNLELEVLADQARFRKDLIYRINTVELTIPPLRERGSDVKVLARHFTKLYTDKYFKDDFHLDKSFFEKLTNYKFPGNVRELQYTLERAVIMAENQILSAENLMFSPIERYHNDNSTTGVTLESVEKNTILKVIEKNNGNISQSAKDLGITRAALYRRLHKYGL